jgi:hypothetical protein
MSQWWDLLPQQCHSDVWETLGRGSQPCVPGSAEAPLGKFPLAGGLHCPSPGRPSSPQLLLLWELELLDAPWLTASVFLERTPGLAPCQAFCLQRGFLGRTGLILLSEGRGASLSLLTLEDLRLWSQSCFRPLPLSETPVSCLGNPGVGEGSSSSTKP